MYLVLADVVEKMIARLTGPMSFRFILQPAVAVFLGIRDDLMDAKAGTPPFIADLVMNPKNRKRSLKAAFKRLLTPILVATVLDAIAQYLIFKHVRLVGALLVGAFVMGLPYAAARGISNRVATALRGAPRSAGSQRPSEG